MTSSEIMPVIPSSSRRTTNMKQLFKYILFLAGIATSLYSCNPNDLVNPVEDGNRIELTISLPGLETKAPGEDRFNENKIDNIYYFFYPEGATGSAPVLSGSFAGSETQSISVSQAKINELFPGGMNRCRLFLVANPPADVASDLRNSASATYNHVRSIVLTTDLNGVQDSFVMTGDTLVDLINRNPSTGNPVARANVELRRLASKITITAIVKKTHIDSNVPDVTWTSQADGLKAYFVNGMNKTNLAGDFSMFSDNDVAENRFESLPVSFTRTEYDSGNDLATFTIPLYSYPMVWDFEDEREPYLLFELPLQSSKNNKYQLCYYKFMLSEKEMTSNHWYDITVHLNVMGSFFRNEPMQQFLRQDYLVLDWRNAYGETINERDENVEADVKAPRYLVFNQDVYEVYNMERLSIPYSSSHPVTFTIVSATKPNYAQNNTTYTNMDTNTDRYRNLMSYSSDGSQVLEFYNPLDNDLNSNSFDCVPWTFTIDVKHSDNDRFIKRITVVQYPAIYIDKETNSAGRNVDRNVWVNGGSLNTNHADYNYAGAWQAENSGGNSSQNMIIISVGRVESDDYIIGDPRNTEINNFGEWTADRYYYSTGNNIDSFRLATDSDPNGGKNYPMASGNSIYTATKTNSDKLEFYYPTFDDDAHRKFIAPKFRIASANSLTYGRPLTYSGAQRRCASYQEDGYPAGRWRLATEAEVKFVTALSSGGFIPNLFGAAQPYWYAGGRVTVTGNVYEWMTEETMTKKTYTRCVYDEWYWSMIDEQIGYDHNLDSNKNTFTWGDMPISR